MLCACARVALSLSLCRGEESQRRVLMPAGEREKELEAAARCDRSCQMVEVYFQRRHEEEKQLIFHSLSLSLVVFPLEHAVVGPGGAGAGVAAAAAAGAATAATAAAATAAQLAHMHGFMSIFVDEVEDKPHFHALF